MLMNLFTLSEGFMGEDHLEQLHFWIFIHNKEISSVD